MSATLPTCPPPAPCLPTVIPVLDLMGGQVVRGQGGQRSTYRPIVSSLCPGSEPLALALRLLACRAVPVDAGGADDATLYVADLDAILGGAAQVRVLQALLQGLPGLRELWLDAGFTGAASVRALRDALRGAGCSAAEAARLQPVMGSESLPSLAALQEVLAVFPQALLSLDIRGAQRLDPAGCWARPDLWPPRVIAMSLHRVGCGGGPDLALFAALRALRPAAQWFGAGGLRHEADLRSAGAHGAAGWLVASALHDGGLQVPGEMK
jgi:uncharacterized protein related to proFAR isomerase